MAENTNTKVEPLTFPQGLERYNLILLNFSAYDLSNISKDVDSLESTGNNYSDIDKVASINLPLTSQITSTLKLNWGQPVTIASSMEDIERLAGKKLTGKALEVLGTLADTTVGKTGGAQTGESASNILKNSIRAKAKFNVAPSLGKLFEGVDFRTFEFKYTFIPANETEAKTIMEIVKQFQYYSLPYFKNEVILAWPAQWKIQILKPSKSKISNKVEVDTLTQLTTFQNLVLTDITTNYGAQEFYFYKDGTPNEISISMSFSEMSYLTRRNFDRRS